MAERATASGSVRLRVLPVCRILLTGMLFPGSPERHLKFGCVHCLRSSHHCTPWPWPSVAAGLKSNVRSGCSGVPAWATSRLCRLGTQQAEPDFCLGPSGIARNGFARFGNSWRTSKCTVLTDPLACFIKCSKVLSLSISDESAQRLDVFKVLFKLGFF